MNSYVVFSSLFAAAVAAPAPSKNGLTLPIADRRSVERANGHADMRYYLGNLQYTLNKYGVDWTSPVQVNDILKRATANEPLQDQVEGGVDELYYGDITVGATGPQTFTCDFDTGSADLFVPGPKCGKSQGCTGSTKYDQQGKDEGNTTSVTYGSGQVSGENYLDSVTVAGLTAKKQNVISLTQAQGFAGSAASSLMGMAFSTIANSKMPTYFENLMSQGVVSKPEFGFYLGRGKDGTGSQSQLTLGGRNSQKFTGAVTKVPISARTYWQVPLDSVIVNGQKPLLGSLVDPTTGNAAIDTGTTIVLAPTAAATSIYSRIPGSFPLPLEGAQPLIFAYPCSPAPKVSIKFAGKPFAIDPRDFSLGSLTGDVGSLLGNNTLTEILDSASYCLGSVAGFDIDPTQNLYVVGDTFLKNWYSIYNYKNANGKPSVSFAKSV